jgi:tetratricopeptide (TPR) repeat protein
MKTKSKRLLPGLILIPLLVSACVHRPVADPGDVKAGQADQLEPDRPGAQTEQGEPASADVMYRVFAGEVTGAEGDLKRAASEYLEAAMESEDPAIAERATRVALAAEAWQHAAMAADRWALLQPENIDARQTAARTMMVVGDFVGAEHQLNEMIRQMVHDGAKAWALVAGLLSSSGSPEKSSSVMDNLILDNHAADNPDALFAKSRLLARQGRLEEASKLAVSAIELAPDRAQFHAWAGRIAINLEQEQAALDYYNTAWTLQPQDQRIAMAYAELLRRNGQATQAQEVLASLEDLPATRLARVAFALDSDQRELAEKIYGEFSTIEYPDPAEHAFQAGQAAELLGLKSEAADWYGKIESGDRRVVASLRRAYLTADTGDLNGARNQLAALRLQGDSAIIKESFLAESEILLAADEAQEAYELLTGALQAIPADSQLLYGRAMIAVQLDLLKEAEQDLRQIIEREPQNAAALNALGYTLADRVGRYQEAERLIRAAFELQPEEVSIIDSMGWVAFRMGRLQEAEKYLRDAWARDENAEIAAHLGEVLWASERREEAISIWSSALETDPANTVLNETMQRHGVQP